MTSPMTSRTATSGQLQVTWGGLPVPPSTSLYKHCPLQADEPREELQA